MSKNYFDVSRSDDVAISGWLNKQSPSLFVSQFQSRYVVVTGNDKVLRYFKQEDDMKEAGSCYLSDIELVQQKDNEPDCRIFVIKMKQKDRLFVFESTDYASMMTWVRTIKKVVDGRWSKGERTEVQDAVTSSKANGGSPASSPSSSSNRHLDDNVIKSGFLMKESSNKLVMNMQRRWVEISSDDNILRYYKNQSDPEPAGSLNLTLLEKVYRVEDSTQYRFRLKSVLLDCKSLLLEASSVEEMDSWIAAIRKCMPEHRRQSMDAAIEDRDVDNSVKMDEPDFESRPEGGSGIGGEDDSHATGRRSSATGTSVPRSNSLTGRVVSQIFGRRTSRIPDSSGSSHHQRTGGKKESVLNGFLDKKSGSKLVAELVKWQRRYVSVDVDGNVRYYKSEGDAEDYTRALFSIDLRKVEFVRPYDTTEECSKFEIGGGDDITDSKGVSNRVYLFDAGSAVGRDRWVKKISEQIAKFESASSALLLLEDPDAALPEKPPIVALYDREGKDALLDHIKDQLEALYPPLWDNATPSDDTSDPNGVSGGHGSDEGQGGRHAQQAGNPFEETAEQHKDDIASTSSLDSHNKSAKAVLAYHATILKDVRKTDSRRARYDVMALATDAVNRFLDLHLMLATMQGPAGSIDGATTAEVYSLITTLTGHQHALGKLYCPVSGNRTGTRGAARGSNASSSSFASGKGCVGLGGGVTATDDGDGDGANTGTQANQGHEDCDSPRDRSGTGITRGSVGTELHDIIISQGSTGASIVKSSCGHNVYRFHCEIFELLPDLCKRYIDGNKSKGIVGTADVLVEQCAKIWQELVKNPADMIQMNQQDGSFYTEMPTLVWRSLHSHAHLAQAAGSTLLHVMVAAKIAASLVSMTRRTSNYVESIADIIAGDKELREVELEYMCALANDIATHIEEVIALVDGFTLAEVREKVNDNFDYVTEKLVASGQICLKRIIEVILTDVQKQFDEIWSVSWLNEGKQLQVAIATIGDYMSDLRSWLMPFWYNKFTVMMAEEVTLRFTYAVLSGPERAQTRGGGGNDNSDREDDDEEEDFDEVTGDILTFGRVSKDINTLNAFFGSVFPDLQDRREELALSDGGMRRKDSAATLASGDAGRESTSGGGDDNGADDTADIIMVMELLNGLTTYLVADIHQSATRAAQKIAQFPSSAEAIGWFVTASLELRDDVDEDDMEEILMILEPAMNSAPDAAFYNENNGIAEGRLGPVYDALFVLAGEPSYRGNLRDSGFDDGDSVSLQAVQEHLSQGSKGQASVKGLGKSLGAGAAGGGDGDDSDGDMNAEYDDDGQRIVNSRRRSVTAGGNSVTHRLKLMSNIPLAALKSSLAEVNRVIQSQVADSEEDYETLSEEEQRRRYETVKEERLQRARAVSKNRIRRSSFFQRSDALMENAADLIAGAEEDAQEDFEQLRAAQDALDDLDREQNDLANQKLNFQGYLERRAMLGLWQSRCYKLDSRVVMDAEGAEDLQHLFLEYNKKGGMLQESFPLSRMCRLVLKGGPRGVVYLPQSKSLMLATEAANKGLPGSAFVPVTYVHYGDGHDSGGSSGGDSKHYILEYCVSPQYPPNNPSGGDPQPLDKLHQHPHLLRTDNEKKFLRVVSMIVAGSDFAYDSESGSFVRPTPDEDS